MSEVFRASSHVLFAIAVITVAVATTMFVPNGYGDAGGKTSRLAADQTVRVVVFPLEASSESLAIYSRSLANVVAKALSERLGMPVSVAEATAGAAAGVELVIAGSIQRSRDGYILEARVRDPDRGGRRVGAVSVRAKPLGQIKLSALDLARKLAPIVSGWNRLGRTQDPIRLPGSEHVFARVREQARPAARNAPSPENEIQDVAPPLFVVATAAGMAASGNIRVERAATDAAYAFVERLGITYAGTDVGGGESVVSLANAARQVGASYTLALFLTHVEFSYHGILAARGGAIVRLVNRSGVIMFEKRVHTDTIVGNRGDRHTSLVYGVAEQCLDIAFHGLREALTR